jgi:uncharacterized protein (DUF1697 family)
VRTWVALLRGVNVGGHNSLPMKRLREILTEQGFEDAATYIQSGNCVFRSGGNDAEEIRYRIANAIQTDFGFRPSVFALPLSEFEQAIAGNPFADHPVDPKYVHLFFLAKRVEAFDEAALRALAAPGDDFMLSGKIFYLLTPAGIGRSKLVEKLGKFLPVDMTGRNLRSVTKIAKLGRSLS